MKPSIVYFFVCLNLIFWSFSCQVQDEESNSGLSQHQQIMVSELNEMIDPISNSPLAIPDRDLKSLEFLGNIRVAGMGEATHGTSEFFAMKHRIFQYLVEYHGYRAIGFEADLGESVYIDRYITGGDGDLIPTMTGKMIFWCYKNREVYKLLRWMRAYNTGKPRNEMIRYFGLDCQHYDYQEDLLCEYLGQVDPEFLKTLMPLFEEIKSQLDWEDYRTMTVNQYEHYLNRFENLDSRFERNHSRWAAVLSEEEYQIHRRLVRTLIQIHTFRFFGSADIPYSYHGGPTRGHRDQFMGDNALWLLNFMGNHSKIALWAHNGHVADNPAQFGPNIHGDVWGSMGFHLRKALGEDYQVLGFSFSTGSFMAVGQDKRFGLQNITSLPLPGSVNFIFHHAAYGNFILPFRRLQPGRSFRQWLLSDYRHHICIGAMWLPQNMYERALMPEFYDVIIYFDRTTAADQF